MIKNFLIISILALSGVANAQMQNLKVVGKDHIKGQKVYPLHQMANQKLQSMGKAPRNFELVGVTLEAKSRRGKGKATLIVGRDQSTKTVRQFGDGVFYEVTAPWAYNTMRWDLSGFEGNPNEVWRLKINGDVKIRSIVLHVARRGPAKTRVRIGMGGQLMTQQSTLFLRRELNRLGYNTKGRNLRRVVLVAKSKAGRGQARLQVGNGNYGVRNVAQAPHGKAFQNESPQSYNRIPWNVRGRTPGVWQIDMRGRIKVKAVIVEYQ